MQRSVDAILLSNPTSIFYLSGAKIEPFERMWLLLVPAKGESVLFANKLFVFEDTGIETVWHTDSDNAPELLCSYLNGFSVLGVDRDVPAKYLVPILHSYPKMDIEVSNALEDLRIVKDEEELELMRISSKINDEVIVEAFDRLRPGMTEKDLSAIIEDSYVAHGAQCPSFGTIVAFGANAADPHHEPDNTVFTGEGGVLIDMGCTYREYCSDMTRTCFYGRVTEKEKLVYNTVLEATEKAKTIIKPGVRFCDIDAAARNHIAEAGFGEYFTHRLGHCIGLMDHEPEDVGPVNEHPVREGMVFSIEPGIYVPGEVGVRIEDLVIVTKDGYESLNHVPRDLVVKKI
ncbi:MAG: aminopeptidase P family protein [Oscillospiraceae bacterium]|nr:aminopeptidase P family protein [Oscillospiraceae bacterium]